jgi:dGTPase
MSLGTLRFPVSASRGRRYPELVHPYRNEFQRDRDRVVHSKAFRRLENKTQVFTPSLSDHFRNRLTHTIEVAQIARTVASVLGLDEDLTEALALAHDVGHPPFAHSGEEELNRQMQRFGERFDHNLHSLRIVENFEHRYARFPGLNLTFEVREGIVKHSRDVEPGASPLTDEYLPGYRPPLEAQLIDLADEIAYNTADLDDGFNAGMFSLEAIRAAVPEFAEQFDTVENQFPGSDERLLFLETLRGVVDLLVSGLIEGTWERAREAGVNSAQEVREHSERLAAIAPAAAATNRELKRFLHEHMYSSPQLLDERARSNQVIAGLFAYFLDDPQRMPPPHSELAREEAPHRVICDYIAGMTDPYCLRVYQQALLPELP